MSYLIYRTDFNNTIVRETLTNTASGGTEQAVIKSLVTPTLLLPDFQPIYYWKIILPTTLSPNDEINVKSWQSRIAPPLSPDSLVTVGFITGYTASTGLQQVTVVNAVTNIESSFNGGLIVNKIKPTGDTLTAFQINKADGTTPIISIDSISGLTGFGTIAPNGLIHAFGANTYGTYGDTDTQLNAIVIDGISTVDKDVQWAENGEPRWLAETYRDENSKFWYLYNVRDNNAPIVVSETGRIGINNQTNIMNYHATMTTGDGLDDMRVGGIYTQNYTIVFNVEIVNTGSTDVFRWKYSNDNGNTYGFWSPPVLCALTPIELLYGVTVKFINLTGHTIGNAWTFAAWSQLPIGTFVVTANAFTEILSSEDYSASPITYKNVTADGNGADVGYNITIFKTGTTDNSIYFGNGIAIDGIYVNLLTAGGGVVLIVEYWNGSTWGVINDADHFLVDGTRNLTESGNISWNSPSMIDWSRSNMIDLPDAENNLYWIRFRTTTSPTTAPVVISFARGGDKRFAVLTSPFDFKPNFYVDSLGRTSIGGGYITGKNKLQISCDVNYNPVTAADVTLFEIDSDCSSASGAKFKISSNDSCGSRLMFVKTRGTLSCGISVVSGDTIGNIEFRARVGGAGGFVADISSQYVGDGSTRCADLVFSTANGTSTPTERFRIDHEGNTGFGIVPTAIVTLKAGTTSIAPLKFNSGTLLSSPQSGAMEFDGNSWHGTITGTTGNSRNTFAFLESPIFIGNPQLPIGTCLIPQSVNLNDYIWNSGGTNNSCLYKTCDFNKFTGSTQPTISVTGATNGLTKSGSHDIKLGGLLVENTFVGAGGYDFTLCAKKFTISSTNGTDIYDALGKDINIFSSGGTVSLYGKTSGGTESMRFILNQLQATFTDSRVIPTGIEYNSDYSSTFVARSLVDKAYVDANTGGGIIVKASVLLATTGNTGLSGLTRIDSTQTTTGMRILVKNQASNVNNGVYSASTGVWGRVSDFNETAEIVNGSYFFVNSGTTNAKTAWVMNAPEPIIVGISAITFTLFSSSSGVVQGVGTCVTQIGGNYNISVKAPANSGLCADSTGTYINPNIGGTGICYGSGMLCVYGAGLAGNSISWTGNTFNVNPASGTLSTALGLKLDKSIYQTYTGTTAPATYASHVQFDTYTGTTAPATYSSHIAFDTYTGTTAPATYQTISIFNSYTGATKLILDGKAYLSGATFSGVLRSPKAAQNDNSTCVATTSWYITQGATAAALMDGGTACIGTSNLFAREDHVHPYDTSRLAVSVFNGYTGTTAPATYVTKSALTTYTGTTAPATYVTKSALTTYTGTTAPATYAQLNTLIVTLTGTTVIDATYKGKTIEANGTFTITFPNGMTTGMNVDVVNVGAGVITLAASTTLQSKSSRTKLASQYIGASVYHRGSNVWLAVGDLTP